METFSITFTELLLLMGNSIPPKNELTWNQTIDRHYRLMTTYQRNTMFEYISKIEEYQERLKEGNGSCLLFQERFDPQNQYELEMVSGITIDVFKRKDGYHVGIKTPIIPEMIKSVTKKL